MRLPATLYDLAETAQVIGRDGLLARSIVALAALGSWATASAVGQLSWPATIVVWLIGAAAVASPDSSAPLALIVVVIATWMIEVRPASPAWSLVLALSILVIHAASARAAALGEGTALDGRVARRWLAHTAVVGLATTGLWAAVLLFDDASVRSDVLVAAAAIAAIIPFAALLGWLRD